MLLIESSFFFEIRCRANYDCDLATSTDYTNQYLYVYICIHMVDIYSFNEERSFKQTPPTKINLPSDWFFVGLLPIFGVSKMVIR